MNFNHVLFVSILFLSSCGLKGSPNTPTHNQIKPIDVLYAEEMQEGQKKIDSRQTSEKK